MHWLPQTERSDMKAITVRFGHHTLGAVLAVAAVLGLVILAPGAAHAQSAPYAPAGAPVLSASSPAPGAPLTVSGDGFRVGSQVRVVMFSEPVVLGTDTADAAGQVSADVKIPASFAAGSQHRIELQGVAPTGEFRILSQNVTLAGGSRGTLPLTGAAVVPVLVAGALLLAVGTALVVSGRRNCATV